MAKAKGTTLISLVRLLRRDRAAARPRLDPSLHHYLEERVHASSWYPEADLLALIRCLLGLMPGQREAILREMGHSVAREHMEGVYSHLRPEEDTISLARRAFALWSSQHDSGRLTVARQGPAAVLLELRDYAHPSGELCAITTAYLEETLRQAGLSARVEKQACVLGGSASCRWRASWGDD